MNGFKRMGITCLMLVFGISGMIRETLCADTGREMQVFMEAAQKIRETAFAGPDMAEIVEEGLRGYLRKMDPYSDFLPRKEFSQFKKMKHDALFGAGMDIERDASGNILCMPHPDGPAERAGIGFGDRLTAVDGIDVSGRSLWFAASLITGENGKVELTVRKADGKTAAVRVPRVRLKTDTVEKTMKNGVPVLRIFSFKTTTPRELKYLLTDIAPPSPLILDIRQNYGGDLHSAIECAMLLLPKDRDIVTVKKRNESKKYQSYGNAVNLDSTVFVWQDSKTASAAEVFLAALVQNHRATSIGAATFGKGTTQDVIELSDGSGLLITSGHLVTPDGTQYHGKGIAAHHPLRENSGTDVYLQKTLESMGKTGKIPVGRPAAKAASPQSPSSPSSTTAGAPDPSAVFVCFDKDFDTEEDANIWIEVLERSLKLDAGRYLLQRNTGAGIRFFVCLGPYERKEQAEKERLRLSKAITAPMSIRTVNTEDAGVSSPGPPASPEPAVGNPDIPARSAGPGIHFIQTGVYGTREAARAALTETLRRDPGLSGRVLEDAAGEASPGSVRFRVVIGPFEAKDDALRTRLTASGILPEDAYWVVVEDPGRF